LASFQNQLLSACATAFERRSKALRYHTKRFALERAVGADGDERLNVDVSTLEARPTQVRLSLWPDGAIWFQAAQPGVRAQGGWDFLFSFDGTLGDLPPDELVSMFESSLHETYGQTRAGDAATRLLALWSRVQPIAAS
jgi:hypothetical protein